MKKLKVRKMGKFYSSFEDDAIVLSALMKYRIIKGKVGFPLESLDKVLTKLDEEHISYIVIENDEEVNIKNYKPNNYDKFLEKSKKEIAKRKTGEELLQRIDSLSNEKLEKIMKYIKGVLDEE